jgi:hypothetical protein
MVSFTPRPVYTQGKSSLYPLDRRLGGAQNRSGCGVEEKNSQPLPGLEFPDHPAQSSELYRWVVQAPVVVVVVVVVVIIIIIIIII